MLQRFWQRRDDDEGFTLIELMVVVLIIGILIAIALPTFLGARGRAQDRAAQSSLRNALVAAKTMYTDASSYATATEDLTTGLPTVEPSLTYKAAADPSTKPTEVSVAITNTNQTWSAAAKSQSGSCFFMKDTATNPTAGTVFAKDASGASACTGTFASGVVSGGGAGYTVGW